MTNRLQPQSVSSFARTDTPRADSAPGETAVDIPARLADFRRRYRETIIGRYYNGYAHLAFVVLGSLSVIGFAISRLREPTWLDFICIPVTFVVANFVEYLGHRGPMHRYFRLLGLMFHRHTHEHHQFFTEQWMTCRSQRDFKIVLFPPIMLLFYLGLIAVPMGLLLDYLHGRNFAWLYVATATFYFMSYEVMHFCYHLDDDVWGTRLPIVRALRAHHRIHHKLDLMSHYNFNITWPIADFFFGTIYRDRRSDPAKAGGDAVRGRD